MLLLCNQNTQQAEAHQGQMLFQPLFRTATVQAPHINLPQLWVLNHNNNNGDNTRPTDQNTESPKAYMHGS